MKMKRLVLLGMLLVLAAVPSIANAAPNKGDPITFRFRQGEFCSFGCTNARAGDPAQRTSAAKAAR